MNKDVNFVSVNILLDQRQTHQEVLYKLSKCVLWVMNGRWKDMFRFT